MSNENKSDEDYDVIYPTIENSEEIVNSITENLANSSIIHTTPPTKDSSDSAVIEASVISTTSAAAGVGLSMPVAENLRDSMISNISNNTMASSWKQRFFSSSVVSEPVKPKTPSAVPETQTDEDEGSEDDDDSWNTVPGSEIYVVLMDENPIFYTKTMKTATEKMWSVARHLRSNYFEYTTYVRECVENEISVFGKRNNLIISYETELNKLYIKKLKEIQ